MKPPPPRPRGLPGLTRGEERSAWLTSVSGDLRQTAMDYVVNRAPWGYRQRRGSAFEPDIRALLRNPETTFEEFVRIVISAGDNSRQSSGLPYGLARADLGSRSQWWSRLLRSAIPHVPAAPWIRNAATAEIACSSALLKAAWPELTPGEWAALLPVAEAGRADRALVQQVIGTSGHRPKGAKERWRPWPILSHARLMRQINRTDATRLLTARIVNPHSSFTISSAEFRAALVQRAIAGHPPYRTLELLTVDDRTAVAQHSIKCRGEEFLDDLLATTSLPAQLFEPHATCGRHRHQQALLVNPTVPSVIAMRATGQLISRLQPANGSPEFAECFITLAALLAGRGWLPADGVERAVVEIVEISLTHSDAWARKHLPINHHGRWSGNDSTDALALALTPGEGMPELSGPLRARVVSVLRRQGFLVSGSLIGGLPHDAKLACALAIEQFADPHQLAFPYFISVLGELDEESRVIAARQGCGPVLIMLAQDPSIRVRQHVARNSRAPRQTLIALASDPQDRVSSQIARNSQVDDAMILQLAEMGGAAAAAATRVLLAKLS